MTEREQIEQRIAENERKIAENERKMIEQERFMAKQIKEFLDKGLSKEYIAKATEFPLEYMESLLERFYPQNPEGANNLDIQTQLDFLKQQVHLLQIKLDNTQSENTQLKQQVNTLQAKRSEPIETIQGIQQWEYKDGSWKEEELNKLGEEGWEVVSLNGCRAVLKRPKKCIYCNGTGIRNWIDIYDNKVKKKCDKCNGTGKILL